MAAETKGFYLLTLDCHDLTEFWKISVTASLIGSQSESMFGFYTFWASAEKCQRGNMDKL